MKPSDHLKAGECPFCHNNKTVNVLVPEEHDEPCPLCHGTGRWPPPDEEWETQFDGFVCPRCGAVSHNPTDKAEGYCGRCHDWTGRKLNP